MKILIAEDDVDLNEIIVKKLRAEGHSVETCFNGEDAVEHLRRGVFDAAVMDIMMPVMDGVEAVRELRQEGNLTPVIFLTARDAVEDRVRGLDAGANDYVIKPFSFEELNARIRAVTRTAAASPTNVLELADLMMDTESRIVMRGGRRIELTAREYRLLEFLLRNKNKVLTRQKIEDYVWDLDYEGGTNVVDVYITYLRKKVEEGFDQKLIHTVRGVGYTMREEK